MSETTVERKEYLESLSDDDRENLGLLMTTFLDYCHEKQLSGALLAVGGSVKPETRGTRRKDIDLIPLVNGRDSFDDFRALMEYLKIKTEFNIGNVIEPAIDEEFGIPGLLKHTGSITLQANHHGVPFEFIRLESVKDWREEEKGIVQKGDYYSLLVSSE